MNKQKNTSKTNAASTVPESPILPVENLSPPASLSLWSRLMPWVIGIPLLLACSFGWDRFNQGGVSCWPHPKIMVYLMCHFDGTGQKSGPLTIRGICCPGEGKIAVLSADGKTVFLFDQKGQFLNSEMIDKFGTFNPENSITEPVNGRTYQEESDYLRLKVIDSKGVFMYRLQLKEKPWTIALDKQDRVYVGYGNYNFIQVFSGATGQFLGDLTVEKPDVNRTYLDAKYLCVTPEGYLVVAGSYNVWVYRLPPA